MFSSRFSVAKGISTCRREGAAVAVQVCSETVPGAGAAVQAALGIGVEDPRREPHAKALVDVPNQRHSTAVRGDLLGRMFS